MEQLRLLPEPPSSSAPVVHTSISPHEPDPEGPAWDRCGRCGGTRTRPMLTWGERPGEGQVPCPALLHVLKPWSD
jgi:hypothetical protein